MSDSGVEAGSDADSLGEMSVGSSVSSNEAVDQAPLQAGDHENQIQVDDHPPDHVPGNMQGQPSNQLATAMQQVAQAVSVSSANQQQIHLSLSHQSNTTSHHQFHLQMPNPSFDHSFQFDQSVSKP